MTARVLRILLVLAWLLTPFAAWAVSFLGGWLGAVLGTRLASDTTALAALAGGALLGAVAGTAGWVLLVRRLQRGALARRPE